MRRFKNAEEFIDGFPQWAEILTILRGILRSTELIEAIKWGVPVYTLGGKNIVGLTAFKNFTALWFFQGALLQDQAGKLINAQEGTTRAQRQWRFQSADELDEKLLRSYIAEAIENQKQGKAIRPVSRKTVAIPTELSDAWSSEPRLKTSFGQLAAYKQREYADHIAGAKRADTKARRLEKIIPMILAGKGPNDRYRSS